MNNYTDTKLQFETRRSVAKTCPCGKNNKDGKFAPFKGYVDKGHCHSCGQSFIPDNSVKRFQFPYTKGLETGNSISPPIDYLPVDVLHTSLTNFQKSNFYPFLEKLFREDVAKKLCSKYFIGTTKWGNTSFWLVDIKGKIRQVKVIQYNTSTGRRNSKCQPYFAGKKLLRTENANLQKCFFGEHLLNMPENKTKPIGIVESEKTAVIASIYFPEFVWIATGGITGCKWTERRVCSVLAGRDVVLFPDIEAFDLWKEKGKLISNIAKCKIVVSDLLEKNCSSKEKKAKLDIADFLLKVKDETGLALTEYGYPIIWDLPPSR